MGPPIFRPGTNNLLVSKLLGPTATCRVQILEHAIIIGGDNCSVSNDMMLTRTPLGSLQRFTILYSSWIYRQRRADLGKGRREEGEGNERYGKGKGRDEKGEGSKKGRI